MLATFFTKKLEPALDAISVKKASDAKKVLSKVARTLGRTNGKKRIKALKKRLDAYDLSYTDDYSYNASREECTDTVFTPRHDLLNELFDRPVPPAILEPDLTDPSADSAYDKSASS